MRKVGGSVLVGAAAAIWTIVAGSPWACHARATQVSPQDRFLEAYVTLREADRLAAARDYAGAERGYQQALAQLSEIRRNYPDWEPAVIRYRIRYATGRLADAARKAGAAGQGSPPRPPEGGSGRAPEDLRELVVLKSRIAELQAALARSQEQRDQLFADLSRWRKEATERAPATGGAPAASRPLEREEVERLAKRLEQSVSQSLDTVSAIQKENRSLQNVLGRLRQEVAELPPAPAKASPHPPESADQAALRQENLLLRAAIADLSDQAKRLEAEKRQILSEFRRGFRRSGETGPTGPRVLPEGAEDQPGDRISSGSRSAGVSALVPENASRGAASALSVAELSRLLNEAARCYARGRLSEAADLYEQVLVKEARNVIAWCNLGVVRFAQQRYDQAAEALREAIELHPADSYPYAVLGMAYYRSGKYPLAVAVLERAAAIDGNNARIRRELGLAYAASGNPLAARKELLKALALDPNDGESHFNLALLYASQVPPQRKKALLHYRSALALGMSKDIALERAIH